MEYIFYIYSIVLRVSIERDDDDRREKSNSTHHHKKNNNNNYKNVNNSFSIE